jgi:hypothetical protein
MPLIDERPGAAPWVAAALAVSVQLGAGLVLDEALGISELIEAVLVGTLIFFIVRAMRPKQAPPNP